MKKKQVDKKREKIENEGKKGKFFAKLKKKKYFIQIERNIDHNSKMH